MDKGTKVEEEDPNVSKLQGILKRKKEIRSKSCSGGALTNPGLGVSNWRS